MLIRAVCLAAYLEGDGAQGLGHAHKQLAKLGIGGGLDQELSQRVTQLQHKTQIASDVVHEHGCVASLLSAFTHLCLGLNCTPAGSSAHAAHALLSSSGESTIACKAAACGRGHDLHGGLACKWTHHALQCRIQLG